MLSWFPPENIWHSTGLAVGHWTKECEEWFNDHWNKIIGGQFTPQSNVVWRRSIRFTQSAPRLRHLMNAASLEFLQYSPSEPLRL